MRILFLLSSMIGLLACKGEKADATPPINANAPAVVQAPVSTDTLPIYPIERAKSLIEKCDYVDLIFYNLDFSINISDANNAKGIVASVLSTTSPSSMTCKDGFGYMTFQGNGEILAEAEIFFQQGCTYLVFRENDKKIAACAIPERGVQFFNSLIQQQMRARQAQPAPNGGN